MEAGAFEVCDDVVHEAEGELDAVEGGLWFATFAVVDLDELGIACGVDVHHERRGVLVPERGMPLGDGRRSGDGFNLLQGLADLCQRGSDAGSHLTGGRCEHGESFRAGTLRIAGGERHVG